MDKFDSLRKKTERIIACGLVLAKREKMPTHYCVPNCASCLAAEAKGEVDRLDFGGGFDSSEDICITEARSILADTLGWIIR